MDLTTTTDSIPQSRSVSGRSRNGRFVGAWAGSLATSEIPDYPSRVNRVTWSISEHAKFLVQKLTRDITPSTPASQTVAPQFWHSQNIDTSQPFEPWIYRYRDTGSTLPHPPSNPKTEWPTLNKDILPHLSKRPLTGPASAADASMRQSQSQLSSSFSTRLPNLTIEAWSPTYSSTTRFFPSLRTGSPSFGTFDVVAANW